MIQTGGMPAAEPEIIRPVLLEEAAQTKAEKAEKKAAAQAEKATKKSFRADEQVHEENMVIQTPEGVSIDVMESGGVADAPTQKNTVIQQDDAVEAQTEAENVAESQE